MAVSLDRLAEMQVSIASGRPKKELGKLSKAEEAAYESVKADLKRAKEKGRVLLVPNDGVELPREINKVSR